MPERPKPERTDPDRPAKLISAAVWLARPDLIVALDYPRWLSLSRLLRRTFMRALDRQPVCNGNAETWRLAFSGESIVAWHFRSFARKRRRIRDWAAELGGPRLVRLTSQRATTDWFDSLAKLND